MSKKYDLDELVMLTSDAFENRIRAARDRVQARMDRCETEQRSMTDRERDLSYQDRCELSALRDADEIRAARDRQAEEIAARQAQIGQAIEQHQRGSSGLSPLMASAGNLELLEAARREYRSLSLIESRSALTTALMGTGTEYGPSGLLAPRNLWRASGIPTSEPPAGYKATVPLFTLPTGTALVSEGNPHAEFDDVAPDAVTLGRTGAWSDLSAEANISTSLTELNRAHATIISRDLDLALVTKLEDTPGVLTIDEALVTVAAEAAADVSSLWIVGDPVAVAGLAGTGTFTVANAGDVGSYATRYGGAAIYPTPAATAGTLTVFHPQSFRAFATPLASSVVVNPKDGVQTFGQWMIWGVGQTLVGSAVTVAADGGSGS